MTWLVVHTKARAEEQAYTHLLNQGYTAFLPKIRERKRRNNRWQWTVAPLFPRYLFVNVPLGEAEIAPIRSTVGVSTLIKFGTQVAAVPDSLITYLDKRQEEGNGAQLEAFPEFQAGDEVEILEGPFAGIRGAFDKKRGEERAMVLIDVLGRARSVMVLRDQLAVPA